MPQQGKNVMQQQPDCPTPVRTRLADQALAECNRLGVRIFARNGVAFGERVIDGVSQPLPAEWTRIIAELSSEIVAVLGRRASFLCSVERARNCRVYRPQFASRPASQSGLPGGCTVLHWPDWARAPAVAPDATDAPIKHAL
jgi:hypothetical protein